MRDLESGLFYVNLPTIGAEAHLPFGGNMKTGYGHREAGLAGRGASPLSDVALAE